MLKITILKLQVVRAYKMLGLKNEPIAENDYDLGIQIYSLTELLNGQSAKIENFIFKLWNTGKRIPSVNLGM